MQTVNKLSIVVPVFDEEENLPILYEEIGRAMSGLGKDWEVILIDDGSRDASLSTIKALAAQDPHVRCLSFERNCGQSAGFKAGFDEATGDVVVTMDADLQNDPADIPAMLSLYESGYDMVIGWRQKRRDTWLKRIGSKIANFIRNRLTQETVRDTGCSLKIMRTSMARRLPMFKGMHRFLPTLMKMEGARVAEVKVNHRPRCHGVSKYGIIDRAISAGCDLLAVCWMQKRHIAYHVKERV